MKKIILTALVAVASLSASAQVYVGGALGFQSKTNEVTSTDKDGKQTTTNESMSTFTLAPEIGYTINENWEAGIALNMEFKNKNQGNKIGGEVYGRYNFLKTGIASLFVELAAGVYNEKQYADEDGDPFLDKDGKETSVNGTIFGFGFRPGVKIALSDKVSLVAKTGLIGAQFANEKARQLGYDKSAFAIGVDNSAIKLGVYYSF